MAFTVYETYFNKSVNLKSYLKASSVYQLGFQGREPCVF